MLSRVTNYSGEMDSRPGNLSLDGARWTDGKPTQMLRDSTLIPATAIDSGSITPKGNRFHHSAALTRETVDL